MTAADRQYPAGGPAARQGNPHPTACPGSETPGLEAASGGPIAIIEDHLAMRRVNSKDIPEKTVHTVSSLHKYRIPIAAVVIIAILLIGISSSNIYG